MDKIQLIYRYLPLVVVLLFIVSAKDAKAQDNWWKDKKYKSEEKRQRANSCKFVYMNISDGLTYSNATYITPYFGSEVYLNMKNDEKGYFNPEQSRFIVENFLSNNPVSSFKWKASNHSDNYAFAIGKYKYQKNGFINTYTISISLKYINDLWLIDQIIVN